MNNSTITRMSLLFLLFLPACGGDGDRAAVTGTVTLDGEPLEAGTIVFEPIEGTQSPAAGAPITKGAFEIARAGGPMAGTYRVKINAPRKTGKKIVAGSPAPPGTLVDEVVEAVPARYNSASEERAEIRSGTNKVKFDLQSK